MQPGDEVLVVGGGPGDSSESDDADGIAGLAAVLLTPERSVPSSLP
jgi:hypothetical protein